MRQRGRALRSENAECMYCRILGRKACIVEEDVPREKGMAVCNRDGLEEFVGRYIGIGLDTTFVCCLYLQP